MKTMTAKFPGTCRKCNARFPAGEQIQWSPETGATHADQCPALPQTGEPGFDRATRVWPTKDKDQPAELLPGVYEVGNDIYVVRLTRDKQRTYASKLVELNTGRRLTETGWIVPIDFEYAKGAIYDILPEHRMSLDRAKELTIRYGRCIVCTRHLKAAKSVEQGMGPVCIKTQLGVRLQQREAA